MKVLVMKMVGPAIVVPAPSAPPVMMAATAAPHVPTPVSMPALHLERSVILCNESAG